MRLLEISCKMEESLDELFSNIIQAIVRPDSQDSRKLIKKLEVNEKDSICNNQSNVKQINSLNSNVSHHNKPVKSSICLIF